MENRKIETKKEERGKIVQMQESEGKEKKELNSRIKKLKKGIERNDLEELIIHRSKTPDEINTQIDS